MKEYIAKADMTITLNHNGGIYRIEVPLSKMDGLKTVTKADIFREFASKIKNEISLMKSNQKSSNTDFVTGYISGLSALEGYIVEMENEE